MRAEALVGVWKNKPKDRWPLHISSLHVERCDPSLFKPLGLYQ